LHYLLIFHIAGESVQPIILIFNITGGAHPNWFLVTGYDGEFRETDCDEEFIEGIFSTTLHYLLIFHL
jgi:hypothetical protein